MERTLAIDGLFSWQIQVTDTKTVSTTAQIAVSRAEEEVTLSKNKEEEEPNATET